MEMGFSSSVRVLWSTLMLIAALGWSRQGLADNLPTEGPAQQSDAGTLVTGRLVFSGSDFNNLIGIELDGIDADKASTQSIGSASAPLRIQAASAELNKLRLHLAKLERQRDKLRGKLEQTVATEESKLRAQRRKIQQNRLNAGSGEDATIARALYSNLIRESNAKTRAARELSEFDRANSVVVEYAILNENERWITNISVGTAELWSVSETPSFPVAKRN